MQVWSVAELGGCVQDAFATILRPTTHRRLLRALPSPGQCPTIRGSFARCTWALRFAASWQSSSDHDFSLGATTRTPPAFCASNGHHRRVHVHASIRLSCLLHRYLASWRRIS